MASRIRTFVYIVDFDCDPGAVTAALGIQPTRTWLKGERIEPSIRVRTSNGWELAGIDSGEGDPVALIRELLKRLPSTLAKIGEISSKWDAQLAVVMEIGHPTPPFNLDRATIRRLADLSMSLDVDLYVDDDLDERSTY